MVKVTQRERDNYAVSHFKGLIESIGYESFILVLTKSECDELIGWLKEKKIAYYVVKFREKYKINFDRRIELYVT